MTIYYNGSYACKEEQLSEKIRDKTLLERKDGKWTYSLRDGYLRGRDQEYGWTKASYIGFPSQCGIIIYHELGWEVPAGFLKYMQDVAENCGYSIMMVTLNKQQDNWRKALITDGWKELKSFKNQRSENMVYILIKTINPLEATVPEEEDDDDE